MNSGQVLDDRSTEAAAVKSWRFFHASIFPNNERLPKALMLLDDLSGRPLHLELGELQRRPFYRVKVDFTIE